MKIYMYGLSGGSNFAENEHVSPKEMDGCTRNLIWVSDKRWHTELN
jgi:hypothetical protein